MKKIVMLLLALASCSMMNAWGGNLGSHSTHYGKVTVSVDQGSTGMGTVYLSTSKNASSGETSATWNCNGSSSGDKKTYYLYAVPANENYGFVKWMKGSTQSSTQSPYAATITATSTSSSKPTTFDYVAYFAPYRQYRAKLICQATEGGRVAIGDGAYSDSEIVSPERICERTLNANESFSFTVHAQATAGWSFVRWADANGNELSKTADYTYKVTSAKYGDQIEEATIVAVFAQSHTYYAKTDVYVDETCPNGGLVAISRAKSSSGLTYDSEATLTDNDTLADNSASFTYYAFAKCADDWWDFGGWYEDGQLVSSELNFSFDSSTSSEDAAHPAGRSLAAKFVQAPLVTATCERSEFGSYMVSGTCNTKPTAEKVVSVGEGTDTVALPRSLSITLSAATPVDGYKFRRWWKIASNGSKVTLSESDSVKLDVPADGLTVGADFIQAGLNFAVGESYYENFADAVTAAKDTETPVSIVGNYEISEDFTIAQGVEFVVPTSAKLTVSVGATLTVDGTLTVVGSLVNNGAVSGSGTLCKVSYIIEQGEIKKPLQVTGEEWGKMEAQAYKPYYRVTTTTANTPKITLGTISGCAEKWAVLFKGKAYTITKQSPKALKVTFDTAIAANHIKAITDDANIDSIGDNDCVLLADCSITGTPDDKKRAVYSKTVDCADKTVTMTASGNSGKIAGSNALFLNGAVSISPSSENQNSKATFINCSSISLTKIKGVSPTYYFYDCGSDSKMASLSFAFYGGSSNTTNYRQAYFYSGYYSYTFSSAADATDGGGHSYVYNGSFSSNPTAYLQQSASPNGLKVEGTNPYKVVENVAAVNCVQVGDKQYASLAKAVSAVSSDGTLSLLLPVTLTEKLVIPSGKQITIDLNGLNLAGGSIENSGALRFEDNSGAAQLGTLSTPVVGKAGTIDITFGNYAGTFAMEGGVLTTHNGTFASTFAATEAGGTVSLKGGKFEGTITVPDGYRMRSGYLGEKVIGYLGDASQIGYADVSYQAMGLNPKDDLGLGVSDAELYRNFVQSKTGWSSRNDYIGREAIWDRLAELRSIVEPIKGQAFEASLSFDRAVKSGTVSGWAKIKGISEEMAVDKDVASDEDYHILIPIVTGAGYTAKSFKHMFDGEDNGVWYQVHCGIENKSLDNIGTTATIKFQIRMGGQKDGYIFDTERFRTYKFTGNGAIYGKTDYVSLAAALKAANCNGAIRLSKDCAETIEIDHPCTFTLDCNNFAFTGEIKAAEGYAVVRKDDTYSVCIAVPVVIDEEGEDEPVFNVEVTAEQIAELDVPADATPEVIKEKLEERDAETGLKNWEVLKVEEAKKEPEPTKVLAKVVETKDAETGAKVVETKAAEKVADTTATGNAALKAGIYQFAYEVEDSKGNKATIADPESTKKVAIVRNDSAEQTIILPVPGEDKAEGGKVNVENIIDSSSLVGGEVITYYDENGVQNQWTFDGSSWGESNTLPPGGSEVVKTEAGKCELPAGGAFWLTRANVEKPVVIIAQLKDEIAPKVTGKEWNLEANPDPVNEVELDKVVKDSVEGDRVIIPGANGAKKIVSRDNNGEWKMTETKVENGRVVTKRVSATIKGGQGFWYQSNDTKGAKNTSIKWK